MSGGVDAHELLAEVAAADGNGEAASKFEKGRNGQLLAQGFDRAEPAAKGLRYERLDQLTIDILLGVR